MIKRVSLGVLIGVISILVGGYLFFWDKIYPGVKIGDLSLTGLTKLQANDLLRQSISQRVNQPLMFQYQNQSYSIDLSNYPTTPFNSVIDLAFSFGHSSVSLPHLSLPAPELDSQIQSISEKIRQNPTDSQLVVTGEEISTTPSGNGLDIDSNTFKSYITTYINSGFLPSQKLPTKVIPPQVTQQNQEQIKATLDKIKLSPLKLNFKDFSTNLDLSTILSLIDTTHSQSSLISLNTPGATLNISQITLGDKEYIDRQLSLDQEKLDHYLQNLSAQLNQVVKEPIFDYDGKRVTNFQPPQEGRQLNLAQTKQLINQRLLSDNLRVITLPVETIQPQNKLVNQLGIKELIGRGVSHFAGSIPNRAYNVNLTAQKINGAIVAPGQEFSFNQTVGDVSSATGFKQAYVIQQGHTVLGDGGGVCQDSTTLFRAVLNAGLPVTSRTAHSYRVGYYEQSFPPGLDATTYYPDVDFRFKNDTSASILIQAYTEGTDLYVDLYGTSDGRVISLTTPTITSQTPPPPDLRQDDPTLPKGEVKQVDFAAWGASVVFHRTVTRDGVTLANETWRSNYQPWQAVYLVGTGG